MNQRGVTLIEILFVISLIGIMAAFAIPRFGDAIARQDVRSARTRLIGTHARARATAIQRGTQTSLIVNNGRLVIQSTNPVTNAVDTVGNEQDMGARYGVMIQPTNLTLRFDGRGVGLEAVESTIAITKGAHGTQIRISPVGRVWQ